MALKPTLKKKIDELFLAFLSTPDVQKLLDKSLQQIKNGEIVSLNGCKFEEQPVSPSSLPYSPAVSKHEMPVASRRHKQVQSTSKQSDQKVKQETQTVTVRLNPPEQNHRINRDKLQTTEVTSKTGLKAASKSKSDEAVRSGQDKGDYTTEKSVREKGVKLENGHPSIKQNKSESHLHISRGEVLVKPSSGATIPQFYFPLTAKPAKRKAIEPIVQKINEIFKKVGETANKGNMEVLTKACGIPLHLKTCLFIFCGGTTDQGISKEQFIDALLKLHHLDDAGKLLVILTCGQRDYLIEDDFFPLVRDVVETHPGLMFLQEAPEFHSRYIQTVIERIFFTVNRSWSGKITLNELRRSNLPQVLRLLEDEEDINQITSYFSYEHFYVIYCKFWELDKDHDLFISKEDLAQHNDQALSSKAIERIFSPAITKQLRNSKMSYKDFVWFLIAEEDKRHATSIEYWFRVMDLDGDGIISMYELEYFYQEQMERMDQLGVEPLPFEDTLCQILDMVKPEEHQKIRLKDLKKCKLTPLFFDTFLNIEKYLEHEQKDPFTNLKDIEDNVKELSDWERYATEEYELLVAEEGGGSSSQVMFDEAVEWALQPELNGSSVNNNSFNE